MCDTVTSWLLEDSNPAIKLRTLTSLLGKPLDDSDVIATREATVEWVKGMAEPNWMAEETGIWLTYRVTALAECGLAKADIGIEKVMQRYLANSFDVNCENLMYLRAAVMLGYGDDERIRARLEALPKHQLPDGGFLCLHRIGKLKYTPKSCMKNSLHALMLYAECKKHGIPVSGCESLIRYFWNHRLFYRTDDLKTLVLNGRDGSRTVDTFYPFELMRVGLQNVVEALSLLGHGAAPELDEAWSLLESKKNADGQYLLDGTLPKSYLPRERVGRPSKWVTLYATLAKAHRTRNGLTERPPCASM